MSQSSKETQMLDAKLHKELKIFLLDKPDGYQYIRVFVKDAVREKMALMQGENIKQAAPITYSVRLFETKDGRVQIIGGKDVRALLSTCGFPPRITLMVKASPDGRIIMAKTPELLHEESVKVQTDEATL